MPQSESSLTSADYRPHGENSRSHLPVPIVPCAERTRTKLTLLAVALLVVALISCGAVAWMVRYSTQTVTVQNYDRIAQGMTRTEIEKLLGGPGRSRDEYVTWQNNRTPTLGFGNDLTNGYRHDPTIEYWFQDSGIIVVRFDSDKRVIDKEFNWVTVSTCRQTINRALERMGW